MAVLKGEGRVPILFGSLPLPVPPNRDAYLARPDQAGRFATIVVASDASGITPSVKALARHLARHGYGVLAPAMRPSFELAVADLADGVRSARIPGTEWASPGRVGLIGIGDGGPAASVVAAAEEASALALVGASLDRDLLSSQPGSLLVLHGASDDVTPAEEIRAIRADVGRGEWVLYREVAAGFFDDASTSHDPAAASDVASRLVGFFDRVIGTPVAA